MTTNWMKDLRNATVAHHPNWPHPSTDYWHHPHLVLFTDGES